VSSGTGICVKNISCRNCETKHRLFLCIGITATCGEPLVKQVSATLMTITLLLHGTSTFTMSSLSSAATTVPMTAGTTTTIGIAGPATSEGTQGANVVRNTGASVP